MEKKTQKFVLEIIPLVRLPFSKNQSFSYLSNEKVSFGSLASIPFFHQTTKGVVISSKKYSQKTEKIKLKPIKKIIAKNFVSKKQFKLAQFICEYYLCPLGIVLKSFAPQIAKARKSFKISKTKKPNIALTKHQEASVKKITQKNTATKYLLYGPSGSGKTEVYIHSILEMQKNDPKKQALIILPELTLTPQAIERYGAYFKTQEITILNSKISKGQFFEAWKKIKKGQIKIIIATRAGIFAPFKKLGLVVVDEEQDMSHKQWEQNPRYDARKTSEELAKIHSCPVVFGSATPRIEDFQKTQQKKWQLLKLPYLETPKIKHFPSEISLLNMKKEYWEKNKFRKKKNNIIFSQKLLNLIDETIKNKEQVILFINRQGLANFSICTQCKTMLSCPKCERALSPQKNGKFICLHCDYKTTIFPKCPKCQNMHFENIGLGTQKIERELQYIFPKSKILRLDNQTAQKKDAQEKIYKTFKEGQADILVGTQMITKGWDLPNLSLVGIIDTDSLFNVPDYFTDEKAFGLIIQVAGRTNRPGSSRKGQVVLQTYNPENNLYKIIQGRDFEKFFQKEIKTRKILQLPPFGKLIKLVFQDENQKNAFQNAKELHKTLTKKDFPKTFVSPPSPAFVPKVRGKYRYQLTIKTQDKSIPQIRKILKNLDRKWIIDIDPISIT